MLSMAFPRQSPNHTPGSTARRHSQRRNSATYASSSGGSAEDSRSQSACASWPWEQSARSSALGSAEKEVGAAAETAAELRRRGRFSGGRRVGGRARGDGREASGRRGGLSVSLVGDGGGIS
nr:unnamed protein product [Digitaria exilis]